MESGKIKCSWPLLIYLMHIPYIKKSLKLTALEASEKSEFQYHGKVPYSLLLDFILIYKIDFIENLQ
jgi:hypothetical protein